MKLRLLAALTALACGAAAAIIVATLAHTTLG